MHGGNSDDKECFTGGWVLKKDPTIYKINEANNYN